MVPAAMPMMPAETMPSVSTTSTLTPMTAVTITRRYGMTVTNETSVAPSYTNLWLCEKIYIASVISAAGATIRIFVRNLSRMEHPCVRVAAMVVSEMNDRLSPKNAPPTTMATIHSVSHPVWAAIAEAMGTRATMVPTDVPTDMDVKQAAMKRPAGRNFAGTTLSVRATVASTAPICLVDAAKAPASTNIHIMSMILGSVAPRE